MSISARSARRVHRAPGVSLAKPARRACAWYPPSRAPPPRDVEAPPGPGAVPQAAGHDGGPAVRAVRGQVRGVRQPGAADDGGARVRRVQLRLVPGQVRYLRRRRRQRGLLLPRVHRARARPRRVPQSQYVRVVAAGMALFRMRPFYVLG